jgi:hypothetical protein
MFAERVGWVAIKFPEYLWSFYEDVERKWRWRCVHVESGNVTRSEPFNRFSEAIADAREKGFDFSVIRIIPRLLGLALLAQGLCRAPGFFLLP